MIFTASLMSLLIGMQFLGDASPPRPFEKMNVIVLCGGEDWGALRRLVEGACQVAEDDLGCTVEPYMVSWDENHVMNEFRRVSSILPSGICIMGYPGPESIYYEMEDLRDEDIAVTSFNSRYPAAEARFGSEGFGYVGVDGYEAGYKLAKAAIETHEIKPGETAMLLGDLSHPARADFRKGSHAGFAEGGVLVLEREASAWELEQNPDPIARELAQMRDDGTLPKVLSLSEFPISLGDRLLDRAGFSGGTLPLIGMGLDAQTNRNLFNSGRRFEHVTLLASQDVALQVYLAIAQVCMTRSSTAAGLHINTPVEIIGRDSDAPNLLKSDDVRSIRVY